jgi:hypothetical protein
LLTSPHLLATPAKIWLSLIERNDSQEREREEGTTQMVFTVHDLTFFKSEIRNPKSEAPKWALERTHRSLLTE